MDFSASVTINMLKCMVNVNLKAKLSTQLESSLKGRETNALSVHTLMALKKNVSYVLMGVWAAKIVTSVNSVDLSITSSQPQSLAFRSVEMERDSLFNAMMETTTTMMGVPQIVRLKQNTPVMEEVQIVKIHAQSSNLRKFKWYKQDKLTCMARSFWMLW